MPNPKISVIIPAFNVEKYLSRCLDSVIGQSFEDMEIIVVNDGSTDGTKAILEDYASRDSRIRIIDHPGNKGTLWTRKTGVEASSCDYITFVDSDDVLKPYGCDQMYEAAVANDADLVIAGYEYCFFNGIRHAIRGKLKYGNSSHGVAKAMLENEVRRYNWAKLYDRRLFTDHPIEYLENFNLGEDQYLCFQIAKSVRNAVVIPDLVYEYYENFESLTHGYSLKKCQDFIYSHFKIIEMAAEIDDEVHTMAETFALKKIHSLMKDGDWKDRREILRLFTDRGMGYLVSFKGLRSHLGFRKACTYWAFLHCSLVTRLVSKYF